MILARGLPSAPRASSPRGRPVPACNGPPRPTPTARPVAGGNGAPPRRSRARRGGQSPGEGHRDGPCGRGRGQARRTPRHTRQSPAARPPSTRSHPNGSASPGVSHTARPTPRARSGGRGCGPAPSSASRLTRPATGPATSSPAAEGAPAEGRNARIARRLASWRGAAPQADRQSVPVRRLNPATGVQGVSTGASRSWPSGCRRSWGWGPPGEVLLGRRAGCAGVMSQRRRWVRGACGGAMVRWAPLARRRSRPEDQAGTESPCSQACQAGSSRRT